MLITVVTVTWNAAAVIGPTLQSIKRQSFADFEYLVVDGASKDSTLELVREAAIPATRIVSEPDKGLYDAMNKAIRLASGEYLVWMNAGDSFAYDDALADIAAKATGRPGVVYGQTQLVDNEGNVVGMRHLTAPRRLTADSFKHGMLVCHQAFVARRDLMPEYDLGYRFSADYDWCVKILKKSGRNEYVGDRPIVSFLNEGTTSKNHKASLKERYKIMCKYYGTVPTALRHVWFALRTVLRRII